jgi:uncharacterized protein YbaR (Trm112 family)
LTALPSPVCANALYLWEEKEVEAEEEEEEDLLIAR